MSNNKMPLETNSSVEHVEKHLQELEKADYELLYYSQEQTFSADELVRVINEERLNELLADSDAFLASLTGEIGDFEDDNKDP